MRAMRWKRRFKGTMIVVMGVVFAILLPQLLTSSVGVGFAAVWLAMALMGAWSVYRREVEARRATRLKRAFTFKKKLRTSKEEARSRITVRLRA